MNRMQRHGQECARAAVSGQYRRSDVEDERDL